MHRPAILCNYASTPPHNRVLGAMRCEEIDNSRCMDQMENSAHELTQVARGNCQPARGRIGRAILDYVALSLESAATLEQVVSVKLAVPIGFFPGELGHFDLGGAHAAWQVVGCDIKLRRMILLDPSLPP